MSQRRNHSARVGRRTFLGTLGAAALASPFIRIPRALAAPPRNLLLFTWPRGLEDGWLPTGTTTQFDLGGRLAALESHKEKLSIITGLRAGYNNELAAHAEGPPTLWTGANPSNFVEGTPRIASVDQVIADVIGHVAPFRSLHFGVQSTELGLSSTLGRPYYHFAGSGQPIAAVDDPEVLYDQLFGEGVDFTGSARRRAQRLRALAFARGDLARVRAGLTSGRREKIETHDAHLAAMERRAELFPDATCGADVPRPTLGGETAVRDSTRFADVAAEQIDLAVAALRCGMTHVATVQLAFPGSDARIPGLDPEVGLSQIMSEYPRADRWTANQFMIAQIARLLDGLDAVSLGSNRTLLDETLVVCASEMGNGSYKTFPIPVIVAGGGGDYFRLGRWVNLPDRPRHTKLLTSILHAFGLTHIESYGEYTDAAGRGPLQEVRG